MLGRNAVKHKNSGIIKGVDQVSWPQEEIHRLVLQALAHRQPCYPLSSPSCTQSRKLTAGTEDLGL